MTFLAACERLPRIGVPISDFPNLTRILGFLGLPTACVASCRPRAIAPDIVPWTLPTLHQSSKERYPGYSFSCFPQHRPGLDFLAA